MGKVQGEVGELTDGKCSGNLAAVIFWWNAQVNVLQPLITVTWNELNTFYVAPTVTPHNDVFLSSSRSSLFLFSSAHPHRLMRRRRCSSTLDSRSLSPVSKVTLRLTLRHISCRLCRPAPRNRGPGCKMGVGRTNPNQVRQLILL